MKLGICQNLTSDDKQNNIIKIHKDIDQLIINGANLILLPECFNSPYGISYFEKYSETFDLDDPNNLTFNFYNQISNKYPNVYFFFGSIPEKDNNKIYNTMAIFYQGKLLNKYRKIHLYDINLEDKHSFQESKVLTAGETPTIIETIYGNVGIGICYDIRFPKLAEYYRKNNCKLIVYPGAFNLITGKAHWELLLRARALDNMIFVAAASTARNLNSTYKSWGHSMIINPWGKVINKLDENEGSLLEEINFDEINEIKNSIPVFSNLKLIDLI